MKNHSKFFHFLIGYTAVNYHISYQKKFNLFYKDYLQNYAK